MSRTTWLWIGILAVVAVGLGYSVRQLGAQCCGGGHDHGAVAAAQPQAADKGPAQNVEYYCPMHPNIVKAEPGKCPVCGMALVKRSKPAPKPPATSQPTSQPTTAEGKAKIVNARCPIMGGAIDPAKVTDSLTRDYKGQKVAFCCGGCPASWDKLTPEQKDAKLKAATDSR